MSSPIVPIQSLSRLVRGGRAARLAVMFAGGTALASGLPAHTALGQTVAHVTKPGGVDTASSALPSDQVESITVSAGKRRQRTRDLAGSVTVLTGKQLQQLGATSYADYLRLAPGVVFSEGTPGLSTAAFRGITDTNLLDQGQGTTGYFLNDIPLAEPGFAIAIPDIDTFDVNRVEVLRGPQSTLFGSSTLGGAIDYVANTADAGKFDAAAQSVFEGTQGGGTGYSEKAMVNVPIISDKLAVRAVLDYRQDPGYVSNSGTGQHDGNDDLVRNARVSVVYTPVDGTKLTYLYLAQNNKISDQGYTSPDGAGLYYKNTAIAEPYYTSTQMHSLRLDQELGFATLTAQAAFMRKDEFLGDDASPFYAGTLGALGPYSAPQTGDSKSMYYEVRLTSRSDRKLTWIAGAAYYRVWKRIDDLIGTDGARDYLTNLYGPAAAGIDTIDSNNFYQGIANYDGAEESVFGEASYHLPFNITATFGGRLYWTNQTASVESSGYFFDAPTASTSSVSDKGFLPKGALRWEPNRNIMVYGLVSEGYRFGQPNLNTPLPGFTYPSGTTSDTLVNYEVGMRAGFFDNTLVFEPTLYWIDWSNIQVRLLSPAGISYGANAGDAVSRGGEFTTTWTPVLGLRLQSNITYSDAHLTKTVETASGVIAAGTQLPTAAKWQFSEIASYSFDNRYHPTISVVHHYVGHSKGTLDSDFVQGGYNTVDLRLAAQLAKTQLTFFITNLANSHGVTAGASYGTLPAEQNIYLLRPRTFGAQLDWHL